MHIGKIPKLTKEQVRVLDEIILGSEIQVTPENGKYVYDLIDDSGNYESIKSSTFFRLRDSQLIKLKYRPSIDIERWS
jgi:hypothetical protein